MRDDILTKKQREVLAARAEGLSIRETARTLRISELTVTDRQRRAKAILNSVGIDLDDYLRGDSTAWLRD